MSLSKDWVQNGSRGQDYGRGGQYSLKRVLLGEPSDIERRAHEEIVQGLGKSFQQRSGMAVPGYVWRDGPYQVGVPSYGGNTVANVLDATAFIDRLRSQAVCMMAGANVLSAAPGNLLLPKRSSTSVPQWLNEGEFLEDQRAEFSQVSLKPYTLGALSSVTRQLLLQSTPAIEELIKSDFAAEVALALDRAALQGLGDTAKQPLGILNQPGLPTLSAGPHAPTWETVVGLSKLLDEANVTGYKFLTTPAVAAALKTDFGATNSALPTWQTEVEDGMVMATLDGRPAMATNQLSPNGSGHHPLLAGNFSDLIFAFWGNVTLDSNPFGPSYAAGGIDVRILQSVCSTVRRVESFALAWIDLTA